MADILFVQPRDAEDQVLEGFSMVLWNLRQVIVYFKEFIKKRLHLIELHERYICHGYIGLGFSNSNARL